MEMHNLTCDNLGMTRDMSISSLSKGEDGSSNYAFENHNIRILAVNDNTKFSVTNEKSTKYEMQLRGVFLGGCTCGRYLVVFMQDPNIKRQLNQALASNPDTDVHSYKCDYIYRLEYNNSSIDVVQLYNGNLNFYAGNDENGVPRAIEAIGYYESEEVQKVYWVDGINQNRFINIVKNVDSFYTVLTKKLVLGGGLVNVFTDYYHKADKDRTMTDGTFYALCKKDKTVVFYVDSLTVGAHIWTASSIDTYISGGGTTISGAPSQAAQTFLDEIRPQYNDYSFDFQGRIEYTPNVEITKNYSKAGTFQAGVIQYFMTYYNKYGVETCLIWNSDLQYLSTSDRGGKADEAISCGFDFKITNFETNYDYLRIYACYRSGINGVVTSKIVTDISLENVAHDTEVKFTDLGSGGINFNAEDMPYIGGQDLRANTLDYKQDTLFLGDITIPSSIKNIEFPKHEVDIAALGDFEESEVLIQEGGVNASSPFLTWAYKFVSPIINEGIYGYTPEILKSQKDVAGFKYREVYRFGIQFMDHEGTWTPAYWLGDKYCNLPPRTFTDADMYITKRTGGIPLDMIDHIGDLEIMNNAVAMADTSIALRSPARSIVNPSVVDTVTIEEVSIVDEYGLDQFGNYIRRELYNSDGERIYDDEMATYRKKSTDVEREIHFAYEGEGCYMATIMVDINAVKNSRPDIDFSKYVAYRLLMADMDITSRRIVEQGVINPTMFNYVDRYYNRPFSIPSWLFRPRLSALTHRHYDTLSIQTADNAELQGIVEKQVPGFKGNDGSTMNAYMFIIAVNEASIWSGHIQWKLIYYNNGVTDQEKVERLYLAMYKGKVRTGGTDESPEYRYLNHNNADDAAELSQVADLIIKYGLPIKPGKDDNSDTSKPGAGKFTSTDKNTIISKLEDGYVPMYIYKHVENMGGGYKVVSSHIYDNDNKSGTTTPSKWSSLCGTLVDWITQDMHNTTEEDVGEELAGKIVLSPAMLPDEGLIKDIARTGSDAVEIAMAIMAALVAAAAVVISALSFGTLAAPMAMVATVAVSAAVSVCAAAAIGMASAAAMLDLERQDMKELPKKMLSMGYYPVGQNQFGLNARKERSKNIGLLLDQFFEPNKYIQNSGLAGFNGWNVPVLSGDTDDFNNDYGQVPFTTGHPYTAKGFIGEDYNAFVLTGKLSSLNEDESDLKRKQNLFCVDESIVTLNAPDIENVSAMVDGSEGLRLDLVGLVPVESTYGMYHMVTEGGLNSNSQVLQGRYRTNKIGEEAKKALGLVNGYLYQDFKAEESIFTASSPEAQVNESIEAYRVFMWNKTTAGFWFPNVTLKSPVDSSIKITEPKGNIQNKIFANMRYSRSSMFFPTKRYNIERPVVCLDSETMLKTLHHHSDIKNYYENVDTISINSENYPLVVNGADYPSTEEMINHGNLKDPVHIRYKETPHIVIPFLWDNDKNAANILPYTPLEGPHSPLDNYTKEQIDNVKLYGTLDDAPAIGSSYIFLITTNGKPDSSDKNDDWNYEGEVDSQGIGQHTLMQLQLLTGYNFMMHTWSVLRDREAFLIKAGRDNKCKYYIIYSNKSSRHGFNPLSPTTWYSQRVTALQHNTELVIGSGDDKKTYYVTKNIQTTKTQYANVGEARLTEDYMSILTEQPTVGTWLQDQLTWKYKGETPYLFLGELVKKVFDYSTWHGGTSPYALQQLIWNPASNPTPLVEHVTKAWGDTYYQRWDCEKTYPFTEEDVNSNVEILSFMLESHQNLDGRCDVNRGIHNLLNTRPHNTIFNNVYSQKDNFFTYQVLDDKFSKSHFEADVIWSLTKNNMDDIDKWTCLLSSNEMSLDGRYGTVRKILNVNDVLIAFQDTAIANIKYNETAALNTTSGLPLQMGNTGKVDGYRMISDTIGCHNKFSISKNSAGVFFADDFGKSFNQFTSNTGFAEISMRAQFSSWFKKQLNGHLWTADTRDNFRVSYDEVTHDLYIVRNDICLIYNTLLQKFTSFMDYIDTPMITRLISNGGDSDTFAIRSTVNAARQSIIEVWKMFAGASTNSIYGAQGAYGYIYGAFRGYSMEYRLNPDPFHDSIFTNYQYTADWIDPSKEVDEDNLFDTAARRYTTFDTVEAKNEYQYGIMAIQQNGNIAGSTAGLRRVFGRQPVKSMFRLWRGDIPRQGDTINGGHIPMSDRMRNPWIHLKFEKLANNPDDSKMTFHNLMVNYYNQYGRF